MGRPSKRRRRLAVHYGQGGIAEGIDPLSNRAMLDAADRTVVDWKGVELVRLPTLKVSRKRERMNTASGIAIAGLRKYRGAIPAGADIVKMVQEVRGQRDSGLKASPAAKAGKKSRARNAPAVVTRRRAN
jgi:hypothetical protein